MDNLQVATVQFENRNGDKDYNLSRIRDLALLAKLQGAKVVSFNECCISGYTFARDLSREKLLEVAEFVPEGQSVNRLKEIARETDMVILAGLYEKDQEGNIYNTYICVDGDSVIAKYRKLHVFISPHLSPGSEFVTFDLFGWKCSILICYDNNVIENVRAVTLLGTQILFAPHVTMCTPSPMPGRGFVDPVLWENRKTNPVPLRLEFEGPKGRSWLMRWLPARAYDNGIYIVFSNPIGMDYDQLKNGCSMILDPYGDILNECRSMDDEVVTATLTKDKLSKSGGFRYRNARRPEIYGDILSQPNKLSQVKLKAVWMNSERDK
ncbi:MAG: nitrilase family protein [Cytophagaceae bacterium]